MAWRGRKVVYWLVVKIDTGKTTFIAKGKSGKLEAWTKAQEYERLDIPIRIYKRLGTHPLIGRPPADDAWLQYQTLARK